MTHLNLRLFQHTPNQRRRHAGVTQLFVLVPLLLILSSGCGMGPEATVTPTAAPTFAPVPTYTATPQTNAAPAAAAPIATATLATVVLAPPVSIPAVLTPTVALNSSAITESQVTTNTEITLATTPTTAAVTAPATAARLTVAAAVVNVRSGPDTTFESIGSAAQGESFDLLARSADGGWWQVCCVNGQEGWIYGELATTENGDSVALAAAIPTPVQPTSAPVAAVPTAVPAEAPVAEAPPAALPAVDPAASSAGDFNPDAQYQIVHFRVLGLNENNGGIRDSGAQHHIFLTVLDANGNGVDGAVVENLVGEKGTATTGNKGPGKTEITMAWEPFKLRIASDPSGPVTSQTSNQMGLAFPHLPDLVGRLGDENYEYGACPTIDIKCEWPIQALHFSYEITFQKVK
jgi:uncharacterized protein YraI